MMGTLYIHKSILDQIEVAEKILVYNALEKINIDYDIIKIDMKNQSVTFTQSHDWDSADEPTVGDSVTVKGDGTITITRTSQKNPLIYHHKWQFVSDDYKGFNVEESKRRSEKWLNHDRVLALNERFNSKIGRKNYWIAQVSSYID